MGGTDVPSPQAPVTVALELPSARVLADQIATIQDLQFVMDCCKRLLSELAEPEEQRDPVVPQALWSAALVAYDRCFAKGTRYGLTPDDVRALPLQGQVMKFHTWVMAERAKIAAHPANPFAVARAGAVLSPPGQPERRVEGVTVLSARHVLVDGTGVRQLGALASELARRLAGKAREQQDTVLAEAQKADLDGLYKLPPLPAGPPGPGSGSESA
jgi:hypothetical protein